MRQALPTPTGLDRWMTALQPARARRIPCAIGVAALHAVLLAALVQLRMSAAPAAPDFAGVTMIIEPIEPLAEAALIQAAPTPQPLAAPPAMAIATRAAEASPPMPRPGHAAAQARSAAPHHRHETAAPPAASPGEARQAANAQPQPTPAANAPTDTAALAGLEAQIDGAVQAASTMPQAARRQHREGRARLRFTYLDGAVDDIALVQSSESRILDEAALAAIRRAHYPAAPAVARGRRLNLLVWIDFRLAPEAS